MERRWRVIPVRLGSEISQIRPVALWLVLLGEGVRIVFSERGVWNSTTDTSGRTEFHWPPAGIEVTVT